MRRIAVGAVVILCLAAFVIPAAAKRKKPNPAAIALFKKAIQESNIETKGGVAFRLQATAHVSGYLGQQLGAVMVEFWAPGGKWRRETLLQGETFVEGSTGKTNLWSKNSTEYVPFPVTAIWLAVGFVGDLQLVKKEAENGPSQKLSKQERKGQTLTLGKPKKGKGSSGECVDVRNGFGSKRRYCFDSATSHLTRILGAAWGFGYEFGDYHAFGSISFPRMIRVLRADGSEMAQIRVTEIAPLAKLPPNLFAPEEGSQEEGAGAFAGCGKPKKVPEAKLIKQVQPVYPTGAKERSIGGRVVISAIIGTDGAVHVPWIVSAPSARLAAAALAAVRQWQYQPATRCGRKIPFDTVINVVFVGQ